MGPVFSKIVEETKRLEEQAHNEVKKAMRCLKQTLKILGQTLRRIFQQRIKSSVFQCKNLD